MEEKIILWKQVRVQVDIQVYIFYEYFQSIDLVDILREKRLDGVTSILCENVLEIERISKLLKDTEFHDFTLYNPKAPHNSKPEELLTFLQKLRTCTDKSERNGKEVKQKIKQSNSMYS